MMTKAKIYIIGGVLLMLVSCYQIYSQYASGQTSQRRVLLIAALFIWGVILIGRTLNKANHRTRRVVNIKERVIAKEKEKENQSTNELK